MFTPRRLLGPTIRLLLVVLAAGPVSAADFVYPLGAVVAEEGTVYVVDRRLPGVWRSTDEGFEPFVVGAKRYREPLNAPRCVALDGEGRLLVGDSATREIYRIDKEGKPAGLTRVDGKPGVIGIPNSIAVDGDGVIHVADLESHRIWRVPADGGKPQEFAVVRAPRGLAFDDKGRLWVATHGENQLLRFSPDGESEVVVKGRPFRFPNEITVVGTTAYLSDGYGKAIYAIDEGKAPRAIHTGPPLDNPVGLTTKGKHLLVVDPRAEQPLHELGFDGVLKARGP